MSKIEILDDLHSKKVLTANDFLASGGEGKVYKKDGMAYKIYHDSSSCISVDKIKDLILLNHPNILGPKSIVRHFKKQNPIGFSMPFVPNTIPICKLFTKTFRDQCNFDNSTVVDLVKEIQKTINFVHSKNILIVDLNEYSILINDTYKVPYFIDVDSWQTPNFKATALMESVRDRKVLKNNFSEESDWFSWGIVIFQLYIGIHPYKGKHPNYLPKDWSKRMDDNVSVFDTKSSIPSSCRPFNVIPKSHLNWFIDTFRDGNRSIPPLPDQVPPTSIEIEIVVVKGTENFSAIRVGKYKDPVIFVYSFGNQNYTITNKNMFSTSMGVHSLKTFSKSLKRAIFNSGLGEAYFVELDSEQLVVEKLKEGSEILKINSVKDFLVRNGRLYTIINNKLMESVFFNGKNKVLHSTYLLGDVLPNATKVFDGCIYQNLLGEPAFMIPFEEKKIFFKIIKELSGYRIVDAKSEENILVVLTESNGVHTRFIFVFDENFKNYSVRKVENVDLEPINFTKIPNKVCVMYTGNETVEVFVDNNRIKTIEKAPIDADMRLFNFEGKIYFTNDNEIYRMDMIK